MHFIAILTFVLVGLYALGAVAALVAVAVGSSPIGAGLPFAYLFGAALMMPSGLYLYRFGASIRMLLVSARSEDLESALSHQRSFWKFWGVLSIVMIAIMILAMFVGIFAAVLSR